MRKPLPRPIIHNRVALIPLGGSKGIGLFAVVDLRDLARVRRHHWCANARRGATTVYAQTNIKGPDGRATTVQMHKLIRPGCAEIDHRDGDGLNNRRQNLRRAGPAENRRNRAIQRNNRSGFRGVHRHPYGWVARIGKGRDRYLGLFSTLIAAAQAYDRAARRRFKSFARFNFPREGERHAARC